jgi:hypothetical protein
VRDGYTLRACTLAERDALVPATQRNTSLNNRLAAGNRHLDPPLELVEHKSLLLRWQPKRAGYFATTEGEKSTLLPLDERAIW